MQCFRTTILMTLRPLTQLEPYSSSVSRRDHANATVYQYLVHMSHKINNPENNDSIQCCQNATMKRLEKTPCMAGAPRPLGPGARCSVYSSFRQFPTPGIARQAILLWAGAETLRTLACSYG